MPRLTALDPTTATGRAKELLDAVQAAFGVTPNMARTMAVNPAVLQGWMELNATLGRTLTRELNERIAIAVAEENDCGYCLSVHTAIGELVGLEKGELSLNRAGESTDSAAAAALQFAQAVNAKRGAVSDEDIRSVREAGYDDADIAAIVAQVGLNVFTNYFNRVAQTVIDFPEVTPGLAAAA